MKKLNIITTLLALLIVLMGCKKECTFVYSEWTSCSHNMQTRTYTSSPSGCTPPADSIQRTCVILPSVQIGSQTWTTKNLDVETYRNGDPIPQVQNQNDWSNLTTGAWCYYENKGENGTIYGKLYNWYAVNDSRGLAPYGYHIPTDEEWRTLSNYLGGESVAGTKMKSCSFWKFSQNSLNGTNTSGFNGLPGGYRDDDGNFYYMGEVGRWRCSSISTIESRGLSYYNGRLDFEGGHREYGYSVRCLRDAALPCTFSYSAWSAITNGGQSRTCTSSPLGCTPPADSIFRTNIMLIKIGTQTWSSKNLDVETYCNGDTIPQVQNKNDWYNLNTGAWCYYENKAENGTIYGKLYNGYALKDPRGLAPKGYHIAYNEDWDILFDYVGQSAFKLKETGTSHWYYPNSNATNTSGFTALPGGARDIFGGFYNIRYECRFWSGSSCSPSFYYYFLRYDNEYIESNNFSGLAPDLRFAFSVRCIKD